jgi:hypothetical protein
MNSQEECVQQVTESKKRERRESFDASGMTDSGKTVTLHHLCMAIDECFKERDFDSVAVIAKLCKVISDAKTS